MNHKQGNTETDKLAPTGEPGAKAFRWLDNFWYHHKWKVIIISFIVFTLTVCIVQYASSEDADMYILYAGPYKFGQTDARAFEAAFSSMLEDRTGDGLARAELIDIYILSDEQIAGEIAKANAAGEPVAVNYEFFANNRTVFDQQILAGDAVICLVDPWLYADVKSAGGFLSLEEALGFVPDKAYDEYSIRLSDTAFGQYFSVLAGMEPDTLLCVRRMSTFSFLKGQKRTEEYHAYSLDVFRKIFAFEGAQSYIEISVTRRL